MLLEKDYKIDFELNYKLRAKIKAQDSGKAIEMLLGLDSEKLYSLISPDNFLSVTVNTIEEEEE